MKKSASIELSEDFMLVLYDLVARINSAENLPLEDDAEQRVLWDLEAELERRLDAVVSPDYDALVMAARGRLRDSADES